MGAQPAPRPPPDAQVCRGRPGPPGHQAGGQGQLAIQISGQVPEQHTPDAGQTGGRCKFGSLFPRERKAEGDYQGPLEGPGARKGHAAGEGL